MSDKKLICIAVITFIVPWLLIFAWSWYSAGVQAEVYQRQGVEMTQWECFIGVKPIERTINIKQ